MPASIVLTGLATNDPVPGNYLETLFAQGPAAGFAGQRPLLLIGNPTTAGVGVAATVYGPDTVVPCQTENDVINLTGAGSELHRMWLRAQPIAQNTTSIYILIVAQSVGTAASFPFTLVNVPTASGNIRIFVGDDFVDTAFAASDTLATITANMVTNILGKSRWPVTAAQATVTTPNDSCTITARCKGPRGNWIRRMASINFGNGSTPNTTITGTTDAFLTGGATADDNTAALATILATRYYYIASAAEDSTQFTALVNQVNTQALPISGIRQVCFAGSVDTQANINTIATTNNAVRAEFIWQKAGLLTPAEMAAKAAALYAVEEATTKPKFNFSGYPRNSSEQALWGAWPAPRDQTSWPTRAVVKTALLNGVTPIGVAGNGTTYLVKRITSRSLLGANADYRTRDSHKRTIIDFFGDDWIAKTALQLGGKNLTDDPKPGDPNQPTPDTTTPRRYKDLTFQLIDAYASVSILQNTAATKANAIFQREPANPSRLSASVGLFPVDILDQTAAQVLQVS